MIDQNMSELQRDKMMFKPWRRGGIAGQSSRHSSHFLGHAGVRNSIEPFEDKKIRRYILL